MSLLLNRAKANTATTGTGTVTLGSTVSPFQSWASAQPGASTTRRYSYLIEDGTAWEIGEGVFNEGAGTITRNLVASSTGALLNLSGSATIACVAKATDSPQVIEKIDLGALGVSTYTFSDIPQEFTNLRLDFIGRTTDATRRDLQIRINGLSTAIYCMQRQYIQNTTAGGDQQLLATAITNTASLAASGDSAGMTARLSFEFPFYRSSLWKSIMQLPSRQPNNATTGNAFTLQGSGEIRDTNPISSITIFIAAGNFATGSEAKLVGHP